MIEETIIKLLKSEDTSNVLIAHELILKHYGDFRWSTFDFLEKAGIRLSKDHVTKYGGGSLSVFIKGEHIYNKIYVWNHQTYKL